VGEVARRELTDISAVVTHSPLPDTLKRFDAASKELLAFTQELSRQAQELDLPGLAQEARNTLAQVRKTVDHLEGGLAPDARTTLSDAQATLSDAQAAIADLRNTLRSLDRLISEVQQNPSSLVFSRPAPERKPSTKSSER
jgi:phospholipid/cholesterol/gamma-HCH transport system substrate-binding protein